MLEDLTGQCANTSYCDFSLGTCQWLLGQNISTVMDSSSQMTGVRISILCTYAQGGNEEGKGARRRKWRGIEGKGKRVL